MELVSPASAERFLCVPDSAVGYNHVRGRWTPLFLETQDKYVVAPLSDKWLSFLSKQLSELTPQYGA